MAKRSDIQYIRFYTPGTAAPRIERREDPKHLPKAPAVQKRIPIPFDPLAAFGTTVAVLLLICLLIGLCQLHSVSVQVQEMETYVSTLHSENQTLRTEYAKGYDLEEIRVAATAMGMIPQEDAVHVTVTLELPVQEEEPTWLQQLILDFRALFA